MTYEEFLTLININRDEFACSNQGWGAWERMCKKNDILRHNWYKSGVLVSV
jgi:hypothetical protein